MGCSSRNSWTLSYPCFVHLHKIGSLTFLTCKSSINPYKSVKSTISSVGQDIPFLHESGDEEALEALVATSDMMVSRTLDEMVEL